MSRLLAGDAGEREIIRRLAALLPPAPPGVVGVGDDCAVVPPPPPGHRLVLKSDPIIEGRHFLPGESPRRIGHKALGRVLSDFAAMGATPAWALVNLVARPDVAVEDLEDIYRGMVDLAVRHGVLLVGGDVSSGETLHLHVFGAGSAQDGGVLLRGGARAGDVLYVTGELGGSLSGRHLDFEPRLAEGQWLSRRGGVTSMCDVSDGVATDARHLGAASGLGVELHTGLLPISAAARGCAGGSPLEHALRDGEDFELLFTVSPVAAATLDAEWAATFPLRLTRIGVMTGAPGLALVDPDGRKTACVAGGFEHFRSPAGGDA